MGTEQGGGESFRPPGERAIEITNVELRDAAGRQSSVFHSGSSLHDRNLDYAPVTKLTESRRSRSSCGPRTALEIFRTSTSLEIAAGVDRSARVRDPGSAAARR